MRRRIGVSDGNGVTFEIADVNGGTESSNLKTHTVNLPSNISSGDLLIVAFTCDGNPTITFPAGDWTQIDVASQGGQVRTDVQYRIADGGEGASISVTTSNFEKSAHQSYRITGDSGNAPEGDHANSTSSFANPPSLTPTWGAKENIWIALCGHDNGTVTDTGVPADYTSIRAEDRVNSTTGVSTQGAQRLLNATSENPASFPLSASEEWVAFTVAVEPA